MADKAPKRIFVKWVRSGIGFTRRQKVMTRSLGLKRLHQVVSCPDTRQVRGLIRRVRHLVEVVEEPKPAAWLSVPEYTILPPEVREEPAPSAAASEAKGEVAEAAAEAREGGLKFQVGAQGLAPLPGKPKKAAKHKEKAKAGEAGRAKKKGKVRQPTDKSHHPAKKTGKK